MGSKQGKSSPAPETQRIHAYDSGGKQHLKPQEPQAGTIRYEVLTLKPQWSHLCSSSRESEPWLPVLRLFPVQDWSLQSWGGPGRWRQGRLFSAPGSPLLYYQTLPATPHSPCHNQRRCPAAWRGEEHHQPCHCVCQPPGAAPGGPNPDWAFPALGL